MHLKKTKPSLEIAHKIASGKQHARISINEYFTDSERIHEVRDVVESIKKVATKNFPRTQNLEYAILKTHLIIEFAITEFIRCSMSIVSKTNRIDLKFSQKITFLFQLGFNDEVLLPCIELLNKARNQVAHNFTINKDYIDEIIRLLSENYNNFNLKNDIERIKGLKYFCFYVSGMIAGQLEAKIITSSKS